MDPIESFTNYAPSPKALESLFLEETEVCNFADHTTIYTCGPNVENVIANLENDALAISEWLPKNHMKLNEDRCHLMILVERATKFPSK